MSNQININELAARYNALIKQENIDMEKIRGLEAQLDGWLQNNELPKEIKEKLYSLKAQMDGNKTTLQSMEKESTEKHEEQGQNGTGILYV